MVLSCIKQITEEYKNINFIGQDLVVEDAVLLIDTEKFKKGEIVKIIIDLAESTLYIEGYTEKVKKMINFIKEKIKTQEDNSLLLSLSRLEEKTIIEKRSFVLNLS